MRRPLSLRTSSIALAAALPFALAACGSSNSGQSAEAGLASSSPDSSVASTPASTPASSPNPVASSGSAPTCAQVSQPAPSSKTIAKPTGALNPTATYTVRLATSCGTIDIKLDQKQDPKTANVFGTLAKKGYYNDTVFHRVVPGFVIQGGDPKGDGTGGPTWSVVEAPPAGTKYTRGVVAMAKTSTAPAGSSSSQFFIVTGADAGLPADYAVAGKVTSGMNVVDAISALGTEGSDGPPTRPVVVKTATLSQN